MIMKRIVRSNLVQFLLILEEICLRRSKNRRSIYIFGHIHKNRDTADRFLKGNDHASVRA